MSLVTGRLTFLSLQTKMQPTNNRGRSPPPPSQNDPPPPDMGNDPSWFIIGGMAQGEDMVCMCVYYFIHWFFVTIALFSWAHFLVFAILFLFLSLFFCHDCGKENTKGLA